MIDKVFLGLMVLIMFAICGLLLTISVKVMGWFTLLLIPILGLSFLIGHKILS